MPGVSGQDVLMELRRDPLTQDIPIVIATGAQLAEADRRALEREAAVVLSKEDLSRHTLPDIVRGALRRTL
jgi:CheY-like chemotaxis protein